MTRYALGCAFKLSDVFMNFPFKKLEITCKQCQLINNDNHRDILVKQIFRECVRIVIEDVIENNITFWLPTGSRKSCIKMQRFKGKAFKAFRKGGKWKDVDILESMFSGYQLSFFMYGNRTPRSKFIYVNKKYKDRITEKTNARFSYGDGKIDTTVKDYYEKIYELFPTVPKNDIKRIMNFGWKSLYLHNSYGGDTLIKNSNIWCYFGSLRKRPLDHFYYYIRKLSVKLRVLYKRKKIPWDGYYYFALDNKAYENYVKQHNHRGRPKKIFKFGQVMMYQILDECKIKECEKKYIFRIPYFTTINYRFFVRNLITDKAELIIIRDPLKFKDILVYNNDYDVL